MLSKGPHSLPVCRGMTPALGTEPVLLTRFGLRLSLKKISSRIARNKVEQDHGSPLSC